MVNKEDLNQKNVNFTVTKVSIDQVSNQISFDKDFFEIIAMHDKQAQKEFSDRLHAAAGAYRDSRQRRELDQGRTVSGTSTPYNNLGSSQSLLFDTPTRHSIQPVPPMDYHGDDEPIQNYVEVRVESDAHFTIVHKDDQSKNMTAEIVRHDEEDVDIMGLPEGITATLYSKFTSRFLSMYPEVALRALLMESKQEVEGLRPFTEIESLLFQACPIKNENPAHSYKIIDRLGQGTQGFIFKVKSLVDDRLLVLKLSSPQS